MELRVALKTRTNDPIETAKQVHGGYTERNPSWLQFLFYAAFNQPVVRPVKIDVGLHIEPNR